MHDESQEVQLSASVLIFLQFQPTADCFSNGWFVIFNAQSIMMGHSRDQTQGIKSQSNNLKFTMKSEVINYDYLISCSKCSQVQLVSNV